MNKLNYTAFNKKCGEIEQRFGRQGKLELRYLDNSIVKCKRLLDFGAGKGLNAKLCEEYYTFDADQDLNSNFSTLDAVRESKLMFDGMIANQVFEHILLDDINDLISGLSTVMNTEAILLATIPNIQRGMYFFNNIDHKTPLMYYHLAAFFELNGFNVIDVYKYTKNFNAIANADATSKQIIGILERLYDLDPAQFIAVVAKKI